MTKLVDAPFEIIGWDINRGGEIKIAFVIAGGDRLILPGRKLRELSTLLMLNPTLSWWLARFPARHGCVNYSRVSEWIIAEAKRRGRLDRLTRH
jgi:hypothetical protein